MEILQLTVLDQTHAKEAGRHAAVGLSVEEVAPAADGLPEQQTDGKADCCGRDHHDHPGSGYQCNGFRNFGMH